MYLQNISIKQYSFNNSIYFHFKIFTFNLTEHRRSLFDYCSLITTIVIIFTSVYEKEVLLHCGILILFTSILEIDYNYLLLQEIMSIIILMVF